VVVVFFFIALLLVPRVRGTTHQLLGCRRQSKDSLKIAG